MLKISKILYKRIVAQAEEAKDLELNNLSEDIYRMLPKQYEIRNDDEKAISKEELEQIIHQKVWEIFFVVSDFFEHKSLDILKTNEDVKEISEEILNIVTNKLKIPEDHPNYFKDKTPGEIE
jgi:hypothetical protein